MSSSLSAAGSNSRLAVVAEHFPGYGSTDRDPDEEVPTISKSLEQLKLTELYPFFSVTGRAPEAIAQYEQAADAQLNAGENAAAAETIRAILALQPANAADYEQLLSQIQGG